jgi:uncharacterized protein (TIGR04255 family)
MSDFLPAGGNNAIDNIAFVVQMARPFYEREAQALLSLSAALGDFFPKIEPLQAVEFVLPAPNSMAQQHNTKSSGVLLSKFDDGGRLVWSLRVHNNQIAVTCSQYTRWNEVWPQSLKFIQCVSNVIEQTDNYVSALALQVIDRFEAKTLNENEYSIDEVFSTHSPYLTNQARKSGAQWHVYQGWFKSFNSHRLLNVLNLSSVQIGTTSNSIIDHTIQLQLDQLRQPLSWHLSAEPAGAGDDLERLFGALHAENKLVISQTLSKTQLEKIGLGS